MSQRIRTWMGTIMARLKGKSPDGAENRDRRSVSDAPTKRYEAFKPQRSSVDKQAFLHTEAGVVYLRSGFLIGRGASCHVKLADPKASRVHASFTLLTEGWLLQDNASKNGTFVNGKRIRKTLLRSGDTIQIGQTVLGYEER